MLTTASVHSALQRKLLNPLARGGYALKKLAPIVLDQLAPPKPSALESWMPPCVPSDSPAYLQVRTHAPHAYGRGMQQLNLPLLGAVYLRLDGVPQGSRGDARKRGV